MAPTITISGDIVTIFDVIFIKTQGNSTTDINLIGPQSFTFTWRDQTFKSPSPVNSPLHRSSTRTRHAPKPKSTRGVTRAGPTRSPPPAISPGNSPPRKSPSNPPLHGKVIQQKQDQNYGMAQVGDGFQVSFLCNLSGNAVMSEPTFDSFEMHDANDAARINLGSLGLDFNCPEDELGRKLLRFKWKLRDELGGAVTTGYAKGRFLGMYGQEIIDGPRDEREVMEMQDALEIREWGDKNVGFEQWGLKEEDFASEQELLTRVEDILADERENR